MTLAGTLAQDLLPAARSLGGRLFDGLGRRRRSGPPRSWEASVDLGMRRLFLLTFVGNLASSLLSNREIRGDGTLGVASDLLLVAATVATGAVIATRREGPIVAGWITGVTVLALLGQAAAGVHTGWSVNLVTLLLASALVSLPPRRRWWPVVLIAPCFLVPRALARPGLGGLGGLSVDLVGTAGVLVTILLIYDGLRRFARQADDLLAQARSAERDAALLAARGRQERESERIIHDHVVHALRAVAVGPRVVPVAAARRACADAVAAIGAPVPDAPRTPGDGGGRHLSAAPADRTGGTGLRERLEALASGALLEVRLRGGRSLPDLPPDVLNALAAATAEALRNVERHAGTRSATVTLTGLDGGAQVLVADSGAGFDPEDLREPGGIGIPGSIRHRMDEVGGWSRIESAPGAGTRVTLGWQDAGSSARHRSMLERTVVGARSTFCWAFFPNLVAATWMAIWTAPELAWPAGGPLAAVLALAFTAAILRPVRRAGMGPGVALACATVGVGVAVLDGLAIRPGTTDGYAYALAGASSAVVVLVVFLRPYREGLAASLSLITAVAVLTVRMADWSPHATAELAPCLIAPVVPLLGSLVLRVTIDRLGRQMLATAEQLDRAEAYRMELRIRTEVLNERIGRLRGDVVAFLSGVATGAPHPPDRTRASLLEAAVRDDLTLSGRRDDGLRAGIAACREAGWSVRLLAEPGVLRGREAVLARVLTRLAGGTTGGRPSGGPAGAAGGVAGGVAGGAVTVSAIPVGGPADGVELTVLVSGLAPGSATALAGELTGELTGDVTDDPARGALVDVAEGHLRIRWPAD